MTAQSNENNAGAMTARSAPHVDDIQLLTLMARGGLRHWLGGDEIAALERAIAALSRGEGRAVAWAVQLADGSICPTGWFDMRTFDAIKSMAVLRDGCRYVFATHPAPGDTNSGEGRAVADHATAMEEWHWAVNDASELFSNASDERFARRASRVVTWIKANRPHPAPGDTAAQVEERIEKLQAALNYWLPTTAQVAPEYRERVMDDATLLMGFIASDDACYHDALPPVAGDANEQG